MKTTVDIPDQELKDAMKFAGTRVKRTAIIAAVVDYNRRHKMAALTRHLGTCRDLITVDGLTKMRQME